jgi:hypothetical protein
MSCSHASSGWLRFSGFSKFASTPGGGAIAGPSRIASIVDWFMADWIWLASGSSLGRGAVAENLPRDPRQLNRALQKKQKRRNCQNCPETGGASLYNDRCNGRVSMGSTHPPKTKNRFPRQWRAGSYTILHVELSMAHAMSAAISPCMAAALDLASGYLLPDVSLRMCHGSAIGKSC